MAPSDCSRSDFGSPDRGIHPQADRRQGEALASAHHAARAKTLRLSISAPRREADDFAAKVEADFDRWSKLLGGELRRHTLADLIDRYMSAYQGKDQSIAARMAWWKEQYGDRALSDFTDDTLRDGLARLAEGTREAGRNQVTETDRKLSPATLNRYKTAIGTLYKTAIDAGWFGIKINPAAGIRQRKENNSRFGRCLEDDERARLLDACDQSADWAGSRAVRPAGPGDGRPARGIAEARMARRGSERRFDPPAATPRTATIGAFR